MGKVGIDWREKKIMCKQSNLLNIEYDIGVFINDLVKVTFQIKLNALRYLLHYLRGINY